MAGIPISLAAGLYLARWFTSAYETEGYRWALRMQDTAMLTVVGGVLVGAVVSQLPLPRGLRRIDVARSVRERSL